MTETAVSVIRAAVSPAPSVSVVIAAYNAGAFLAETLRSILDQPGLAFEVVLVDDASTDDTAKVLAGFTDPRLTLLRLTERLPVSAVRNRAMAHIRAPWICVFDADDVMLPGRLAPYVAAITGRPGAAWGYCGLRAVDAQLAPLGMDMRNRFDLLRQIRTNLIPHPMSLIRSDLLRRAGGYDESLRVNVDYDLWLRLLEYAEPHFHDTIGLLYRRHPGALGHTNPGQAPVFERLRARLARTDPDPAIERRRAVLRDALAFLEACEAGDWPRAVPIGDRLRQSGIASFELDRRRTEALRRLGRQAEALDVTLEWVRKGMAGEALERREIAWSLQESLDLARTLGRSDLMAGLQPLAASLAAALRPASRGNPEGQSRQAAS
jgi:glycosyltransferase involved in cell wall biosynthesis